MIKRTSDGFFVMNYKASYELDGEQQETYLDNKEEFEEMLKEEISMKQDKEPEEVELPAISYEDVELDSEQQERFNEIKEVNGISLDEVRAYTINGTESDSIAFKTYLLEKDNADIWYELMKI